MPDPLETVLRLRRVTVDDAKRHLAATLRGEEEAIAAAAAADKAIAAEGEAASDLGADDAAVEAYGAWLPVGRARLAEAIAAADRASSEVAKARAALTVARAAAESADGMLQRRQDARAAEAARKAQAETDEVASRCRADGPDADLRAASGH